MLLRQLEYGFHLCMWHQLSMHLVIRHPIYQYQIVEKTSQWFVWGRWQVLMFRLKEGLSLSKAKQHIFVLCKVMAFLQETPWYFHINLQRNLSMGDNLHYALCFYSSYWCLIRTNLYLYKSDSYICKHKVMCLFNPSYIRLTDTCICQKLCKIHAFIKFVSYVSFGDMMRISINK